MMAAEEQKTGTPLRNNLLLSFTLALLPVIAPAETPFDAAAAFGARESVSDVRLSPDGTRVVFIVPTAGQGSAAYVQALGTAEAAAARPVLSASGKPERLGDCRWASNSRLICIVYGVVNNAMYDVLPFTRLIAVNSDGSNVKLLSTTESEYTRGFLTYGGSIIDWLPDENDAVLVSRAYLPDEHTGTKLGSSKKGISVDWINTQTLATRSVEPPHENALEYITDGRGTVRIMGIRSTHGAVGNYLSGDMKYLYRREGSKEWQEFPDLVGEEQNGFFPRVVDRDRDIAYGFKKLNGRQALYSVALDGSLKEELIYSRPDVDMGGLVRIGRRGRVVGVTYSQAYAHAVFFDPDIEKLLKSLANALPGQPVLKVVDSSLGEEKLLILSSSDQDPGVYYIFDKQSRHLDTFFVVRGQLEGVKLATEKPISYPAADGTMIPGYLTLPPGVTDPKNLPAIVMPHGGPGARDYWGFDWLAQFYAARGYVVLQPNFRGSSGYGDDWFKKNGFRSWPIAIGDVLDAGRWLIKQGIANPSSLAVVGWSYGGYAALQSAVVDPGLFKAVVAIAPVTDLVALKESRRKWSDFNVVSEYIGDGPHVREGSPALNAAKIKVPVLMFQGELDRNVPILQSREMDSHLASAGVPHELVTWPDLDHYLEDSAVRADMLRKSDAFLRRSMGL
jgi:dipeptidyl aminopeptidase/acylaminoacyl peptidase